MRIRDPYSEVLANFLSIRSFTGKFPTNLFLARRKMRWTTVEHRVQNAIKYDKDHTNRFLDNEDAMLTEIWTALGKLRQKILKCGVLKKSSGTRFNESLYIRETNHVEPTKFDVTVDVYVK